MFVCLSVCLFFSHSISKNKLDIEMFHCESWKVETHLFWGTKGHCHKAQKTLLLWVVDLWLICECWLLIVV